MSQSISRRKFFVQALSAAPASAVISSVPTSLTPSTEPTDPKLKTVLDVRTQAALLQSERKVARLNANGYEDELRARIACYVKGLPQNQFAEVEPAAYDPTVWPVSG